MQIQPGDFASRRQDGAQLRLCVPQVVIEGESYRRRQKPSIHHPTSVSIDQEKEDHDDHS
jgi:hypothetical protein